MRATTARLRLYSFFDMGNVFSERSASLTDAQWKAQQALRASVGLGISWISPSRAAARVAYAIPVKYQKADDANGIAKDRTQSFQFQIGTAFCRPTARSQGRRSRRSPIICASATTACPERLQRAQKFHG